MKPWALYNEIDEYACDWLENLIARGIIAPGIVDRRSIDDLRTDDLRGFRQVHFFAGIGVWSYALRCAGVSDDTDLWTGSCPCQPFSAAGKGAGVDDERHLWPSWFHLIREQRPRRVFGEQVASKDGLGWLDLVSADMEAADYAFWPVDTCSAGSGSPHIRQRLRFASHDLRSAAGGIQHPSRNGWVQWWPEPVGWSLVGGRGPNGLDDAHGPSAGQAVSAGRKLYSMPSAVDGLDHTDDAGLEGFGSRYHAQIGRLAEIGPATPPSEFGWMANDTFSGRGGGSGLRDQGSTGQWRHEFADSRATDGLADADAGQLSEAGRGSQRGIGPTGTGEVGPDDDWGLADAEGVSGSHEPERDGPAGFDVVTLDGTGGGSGVRDRASGDRLAAPGNASPARVHRELDRPGPTNAFWRDADWLFCRDGRWRPVEPGTFPLVDGSAFRMGSGSTFEGKSRQGMLKAYGNAIDAEATVDFITAYLERDLIEIEHVADPDAREDGDAVMFADLLG